MRDASRKRREALLKQVDATPGANLRQLHRYTQIPLSTTLRVLDDLEADGRIHSEWMGGTRHFYRAGKGTRARERVALRFVAKPRPRAMLQRVLEQPGIRHADLAEALGLAPPTATYYMKQLKAADLVAVRRVGVQVFYRAKNPDLLKRVLRSTARGFSPGLA